MDAEFKKELEKLRLVIEHASLNSKDGTKVNAIEFPDHLYIPKASESIDIRNLAQLDPAETFEILRFQCPQGVRATFIGYGIFNDALLASEVEFIPRVNGQRILPYHGTPPATGDTQQGSYRMSLGVSPDLANSALVPCLINLNPRDVLTWTAVNLAAVAGVMGVRMSGYFNLNTKAARVGA